MLANCTKKFKSSKRNSINKTKIKTIRKKYNSFNKCSLGAYELFRTNKKIKLTIIASGSEVGIATNLSHKLAKYKIYSKVISMPDCQEIFNKQNKLYKNKIINETKLKISIEAGTKFEGKNL